MTDKGFNREYLNEFTEEEYLKYLPEPLRLIALRLFNELPKNAALNIIRGNFNESFSYDPYIYRPVFLSDNFGPAFLIHEWKGEYFAFSIYNCTIFPIEKIFRYNNKKLERLLPEKSLLKSGYFSHCNFFIEGERK